MPLPYCYKKSPPSQWQHHGHRTPLLLQESAGWEISQGCTCTGKRTPLSSLFKRTAALFFSFFLCMGDKCMHAAFSRCYSAVCRPASCRLGDEPGWTQSHRTGLPPKGEPGTCTSTPQQAIEGRSRKGLSKITMRPVLTQRNQVHNSTYNFEGSDKPEHLKTTPRLYWILTTS